MCLLDPIATKESATIESIELKELAYIKAVTETHRVKICFHRWSYVYLSVTSQI